MAQLDFGQLVEAHLEHERDIEGRRRRSRTNNASEIGDLCPLPEEAGLQAAAAGRSESF